MLRAREVRREPAAAPGEVNEAGGAASAVIAEAKPLPAQGVSGEHTELWGRVVRAGGEKGPLLRVFLMNASLHSLSGGKAVIICAERYLSGAPKWVVTLADLLTREAGEAVQVEIRGDSPAGGSSGAPGADGQQGGAAAGAAGAAGAVGGGGAMNVLDDPLVKQAVEMFGAKVVDVQPRRN